MQRGTTPEDPELPVQLNTDEMLDRSKTLALKIGYRESLVESKKADAKKWQEQIDEADEEIARLARVITDGFENRDQMELFVDDLPPGEAAAALATVAAVVSSSGEIVPSELHRFRAVGGNGISAYMCEYCGSGETDPVHVPRDVTEASTPGEVPPAESVERAKKHVSGGNGKGRTHRTPGAQKARARARQGKAARA